MSIIEVTDLSQSELSQRQRWSIYLTLAVIIVLLYFGYVLRDASLNSVSVYTNIPAGITAQYPEGWLLDTDGDYVFRVRDMSYAGFKTVIQVSILPVSADIVERNLLDRLSLNRSQTFIDYSILGYSEYELPNEIPAISMLYTYVSRDASPFLEGIPTVVVGIDILTIQRGQAIVITFRADSANYNDEFPTFERFIEELDF